MRFIKRVHARQLQLPMEQSLVELVLMQMVLGTNCISCFCHLFLIVFRNISYMHFAMNYYRLQKKLSTKRLLVRKVCLGVFPDKPGPVSIKVSLLLLQVNVKIASSCCHSVVKGRGMFWSLNPFSNSMTVVSRLYCVIVCLPRQVIFEVGSILI